MAFGRNGPKPLRFPEPALVRAVFFVQGISAEQDMDRKLDDKLDPKAKGKETPQADYDRNRDGLYGGLPKARDPQASGPEPKEPHPPR
jgi:hypothetical protein